MGYEDSAACKLLATHCAVCRKELVDSVSVEVGMGPECRKKYLAYPAGISETERAEANALVYKIAAKGSGPEVINATNALREMGFTVLANRLADRLASVVIEEEGSVLAVYTPYRPEVVEAMRHIPGRKFDKAKKANTFPVTSKMAIFGVLKKHFKGSLGYGKKGLFMIEGA